jgi:molybdopterin converting factor small subunit
VGGTGSDSSDSRGGSDSGGGGSGTGHGTGGDRDGSCVSVIVIVRYFAGARAAAGTPQEAVTVPGGATVGGLIDALVERHGNQLARVLTASTFLVDEIAGGPERHLRDGSRVDVLPPFAGG